MVNRNKVLDCNLEEQHSIGLGAPQTILKLALLFDASTLEDAALFGVALVVIYLCLVIFGGIDSSVNLEIRFLGLEEVVDCGIFFHGQDFNVGMG